MSGILADNTGRASGLLKAVGGGGLLQCKQTVLTTTTSVSGNSGTWAAVSGMSVSITPAATANKVLAAENYTLMFLDNPASTSAIAYSIDWFGETGHTAYVNRHTSDSDVAYRSRSASSITAMEIASGAL